MSKEWIFIVDTEQYAGNFERDMCAFMTGMVGECKVGVEEAQLFYEQIGLVDEDFDWSETDVERDYESGHLNNPFDEFIVKKPDEYGCHRPTEMWDTPGWFNHGMGGHFEDGQEEEAKADYDKICLEEIAKKVRPDAQAANEARWKAYLEAPLSKCPAYQSVAIFFQKEPTDEMCTLMMERAKAYARKQLAKPIKVTGFRLKSEETIQTTEKSWNALK